MKKYLVKYLFIVCFISLSIRPALAFEDQHEAHEHGHATLMLVQEKDELQILFRSPAMNITGFEHQANSPEQHEKVAWAKQSLSDAARLFVLNQEAKCALEHVSIHSSLLEASDHGHAHGSHEEDDHAEDEKDAHSEFEAEYHFECEKIGELTKVSVALFEVFTSLEEVEVQVINDSGQALHELDPDNVSIKL